MFCPVKKQIFVVPEKSSFCPLCGQRIDSKGNHVSPPYQDLQNLFKKEELYCPFSMQNFVVSKTNIPRVCPKCGRPINEFTGQHIETPASKTTTSIKVNGGHKKTIMGILTFLFCVGCILFLVFVDGEAKLFGVPLAGVASMTYHQYKNSLW